MRLSLLRILLDVFVVFFLLFILNETRSYTTSAAHFPRFVAGLALIFALLNLGSSIWKFKRHGVAIGSAESATATLKESDSDEDFQANVTRVAYVVAWLGSFVLLTWLIGLPVATLLFLLAFFHFSAKHPLRFTVPAALLGTGFQILIFGVMKLRWPISVYSFSLPWG